MWVQSLGWIVETQLQCKQVELELNSTEKRTIQDAPSHTANNNMAHLKFPEDYLDWQATKKCSTAETLWYYQYRWGH